MTILESLLFFARELGALFLIAGTLYVCMALTVRFLKKETVAIQWVAVAMAARYTNRATVSIHGNDRMKTIGLAHSTVILERFAGAAASV